MRRHFSFANVVSSLALFFALCGGSYAAISDETGPDESATVPAQAGQPAAVEAGETEPSSIETVEVVDEPIVTPTEAPAAPPEEEPIAAADVLEREPVQPPRRAVATDSDSHGVEGRPDHAGGGPPPWAPAHGFRCKEEAAPGSDAFHACIEAGKS